MDRKTYLKEYYVKNKERLKDEKRKKQNVQQNLFKSTVDEVKPKEKVMTNVYQVYSSTKKDNSFEKKNFVMVGVLFLLIFLIANTSFLVYEQVSFYQLKFYSIYESVFFSLLSEFAIIILSFLSSTVEELTWKVVLKVLLCISLVVVALIISSGVKKRELVESEKSYAVNNLKNDLASLKLLEKKALENIEAWDPVKFRSKREVLLKNLEEGLRKEIQKKDATLQQLGSSSFVKDETDVMVWFRYVSLIWNVVLSHLLGKILRREEEFLSDKFQQVAGIVFKQI